MCFVNKNAVNAQFLKRDHIILPALVVQLFQLGVNGFPGALHLLDGEAFPVAGFQFRDAVQYLPPLLFQKIPLALHAHRDFLKLRVPDDDGVIVPGGDSAAEPLAVLGFKVLFVATRILAEG